MALGGEKNHLLNRVKRLLTQENKKIKCYGKNSIANRFNNH